MARIDLLEPYAIRQARQAVRDSDDVLPTLTSTNTADTLEADSCDFSQVSQGQVAVTNQSYIGFGDFGVGMFLAGSMTTSRNHICHVFSTGSNAEMSRLNTDRSVARMQNLQTFGDLTVIDTVGQSVGQLVGFTRKQAVSIGVGHTRPVPTSFCRRASWHEPSEGFGFTQSSGSVTLHRSTLEYVAVPKHSRVVPLTPVAASTRIVATINGAGGDHGKN